MKTYLVTGGCGSIGSNYIRHMMETYGDDILIVNVDALTYAGNLSNQQDVEQRKNYKFVRADICEQKIIKQIFQEYTIDRVVHFAAESHVDKSIEDQDKLNQDTGWHLKTSFEDGIRKTVQWYLKNRKWLEDICEGNYSSGRNR